MQPVWDMSRVFVLILDGNFRSCKDFWVHMQLLKMGDISVNSYFLLNLFIFIQICTSIDLGHGFKKANTVIFLTFEKNRYVFSVIQVLIQLY